MVVFNKNKKGEITIKVVSNSRGRDVLFKTSEGYERKAGALKALRALWKTLNEDFIEGNIKDETK